VDRGSLWFLQKETEETNERGRGETTKKGEENRRGIGLKRGEQDKKKTQRNEQLEKPR
jgi:hypothetical protein